MIKKITISNIASYTEQTSLETDKKINLVYGLNGTGKTILSDYLQDLHDIRFQGCEITGYSEEKILVYNQKFIEENFHENDQLKGIFTLGRENKKAEEAIERATREKVAINGRVEQLQANKQGVEIQRNTNLKGIQEEIWKIKTNYAGGDRVLEFCLKGHMGSKSKLFDQIKIVGKPGREPEKTTDMLKEDAKLTQSNVEEVDPIDEIRLPNAVGIENDPIFSEIIIGNENNPMAALIKELDSSDWVEQGLQYIPEPQDITNHEPCPFCQENTISSRVAEIIHGYFDVAFQQKKDQLMDLYSRYEKDLYSLLSLERSRNDRFIRAQSTEFENHYYKLQNTLQDNLDKIRYKISAPSQAVKLDSTEEALIQLNKFIDGINKQIGEHNTKIRNKKGTRETIQKTFWQIMRWNYDSSISSWKSLDDKYQKTIVSIDSEINRLSADIEKRDEIIRNQQKNTVNIEASIHRINGHLSRLGMVGFSIQKHEDHFYQIRREDQGNQFRTLSEGEKMIISFLYFLERCFGKDSREEVVANKIVVIDDPVSSLSHNYVFDIATLIKDEFFDVGKSQYKQIFILTHSLYFFHELLIRARDIPPKPKLFRITKGPNGSEISEMDRNEIRNEYQSYWQFIKDHENRKASNALLANSMRNILEHFFAFTVKAPYREVVNRLDHRKYAAFIRYMDRESHSDAVNISDYSEIDPIRFKAAFKEIFDRIGHAEHYKKYMNPTG